MQIPPQVTEEPTTILCLCLGYLQFTQFGSFCRKAEAWEWFRLKLSHALPPSAIWTWLVAKRCQPPWTQSAKIAWWPCTVLTSHHAELYYTDTPLMFHPKNLCMAHSTRGPPEKCSGLAWGKGLRSWGHVCFAQETCTFGMLAKLKLSSQGMWTVKEQHLPSSPLVPHLSMTWHWQIFCALAVSRQFSCLAEISEHVRPNSASPQKIKLLSQTLQAYHGPPPTWVFLLENTYFPEYIMLLIAMTATWCNSVDLTVVFPWIYYCSPAPFAHVCSGQGKIEDLKPPFFCFAVTRPALPLGSVNCRIT